MKTSPTDDDAGRPDDGAAGFVRIKTKPSPATPTASNELRTGPFYGQQGNLHRTR